MFRIQKISILVLSLIAFSIKAQDTTGYKYIESELISLAGKDGVSWMSQGGEFIFKPYLLNQTHLNYNYYDDEGLNLAEQDNILNSGFGIPYALVGFAGTAFNKLTFNVAINAAKSGSPLLNQAWFEINMNDALRVRLGKFKTPFTQAYLVGIGQTLFVTPATSLTTPVNLDFDINAVNPVIATGFDLGAQIHGILAGKYEYRIGVFNGTGITQNMPTNTVSDDLGIPSLLYAGRFAYMPLGKMPLHQGDPSDLNNKKLSIATSVSYNVEANYESSNDLRAGIEISALLNRWYFSLEGYVLNMDFVERQQIEENATFWGAYLQAGYFVTPNWQPAVRIDVYDRNSTEEDGLLYMPVIGLNYYVIGHNLKLQAMYQYTSKHGHQDVFYANDDDNGIPEHMGILQVQFAF